MIRKISVAFIMCILLFVLSACQSNVVNNLSEDDSDEGISDTNASGKNEEANGYIGYTNFVKKHETETYVPIFDDIVYDGGEFDIDLEFQFEGNGEKAKYVDALAMLFVDGFIQDFSLEGDEKALVHNITIQNNALLHANCKGVLTTYDNNLDEHSICAVILPYWQLGSGNFIMDTAIMSITREIKLNKINNPQKDNIIQMSTREATAWDSVHSELPFKVGKVNTELIFHCLKEGETCCYVFCDGRLLSQNGKYIFESNNSDSETVSFQSVAVDKSSAGKSLFVLYVSKGIDQPSVERTCNYLWEKSD